MKKFKKKAIVDKSACVACGTCLKACPLQIIHIEHGIFAEINYEKCVLVCPASIINIEKKEVAV